VYLASLHSTNLDATVDVNNSHAQPSCSTIAHTILLAHSHAAFAIERTVDYAMSAALTTKVSCKLHCEKPSLGPGSDPSQCSDPRLGREGSDRAGLSEARTAETSEPEPRIRGSVCRLGPRPRIRGSAHNIL